MNNTKVMLVDDEQGFVEAMSKRLAKRNLEVSTAFSGDEALQALQKGANPDVVILDVKMPGKDGIETLREIRINFPLVEVIMLTGHATVESAIDGMRLGAYDYLMKPCDMDTLLTKVAEATARKKSHEEKIMQAQLKEITSRRV